jgi:tetratricopeptide (TPR) repeat protein
MRHTILLLCAGIVHAAPAQQIPLSGQVSIHNSQYNTGQIMYVKGAYLQADFTAPAESDDLGAFTLVFVGIKSGTTVQVRVEKAGYELVNKREMQDVVVSRRLPLRVYLAPKGQLAQAQTELYNVNVNALTARYDRMIVRLRREGAEQQAALAELEEQLGRTIANRFEAEELLTAQLESLKKRLPEVAKELAAVNLDFASEMYRQAYEYFKAGETEKTIEALDEAILDAEARKVLEEIAHLDTGIVNLDIARQAKLSQIIVLIETHRLKGDMLLEKRQAQAALTEYEKALGLLRQHTELNYPNRWVLLQSAAVACRQLGQAAQAIDYEVQALQAREAELGPCHPDLLPAFAALSHECHEAADLDRAIHYAEKVHECPRYTPLRDANTEKARAHLASLYEQRAQQHEAQGNRHAAIADFQQLLELQPKRKDIKKRIKKLDKH